MSHLELIAKAVDSDPESASALINEIVYSYLADEAEKIRPELENLFSAFVSHRVSVAKRAIGRAYVESTVKGEYPDEDIHKSAKWVADIEKFVVENVQKDLVGTSLAEFNRKHPRGEGGRFVRGIPQKQELKSPVLGVKQEKLSPTALNNLQIDKETSAQSLVDPSRKDQVERNQFQWEAANRNVSEIMSNFGGVDQKDINLVLNIQNPDTGDVYQKRVNASKLDKGRLPQDDKYGWGLNQNLLSIEVEGTGSAANRVAAYNTLGAAGGAAFAQLSTVDPATLNEFTRTMYRGAGADKSKLTRFFDRLSTGGSVLEQIDPLKQYGQYARFVGAIGPEAERVLGPYAQQAAYRYRGTEKEPDLSLVRQFNSNEMRLVDNASSDPLGDAAAKLRVEGMDGRNIVATAASLEMDRLSRERGGVYTPDELKLNVRADIAARHLLDTLPSDPFVAEVSEKAGQILPSQGVIIDADGDIITQSVGFTDDHYLPFDLKNLASLRGGQYVRTRQQGGLTSEDIYTATRAGARKATVISSSGVFSVEFDPTFRGARANSDKAKQMYDRYIKILDAVDGAGLYDLDIKPAEKAKLRAAANRLAPNDKEKAQEIYTTYLQQRRTAGQNIDPGTEDILEQQAREIATAEGTNYSAQRFERRVSDIFDELVAEEQSKRVSELRLNSKGYKVALETLQQQFPYFIRNVSYQPLTSKNEGEGFLQSLKQSGAAGARQKLGASDRGYVQPGGLRGQNIESGTYRTAGPMKPKGKSPVLDTVAETATKPKGEPQVKEEKTAPKEPAVQQPIPKGNLSSVISRSAQGRMTEANDLLRSFRDDLLGSINSDARSANDPVPKEESYKDQTTDIGLAKVLLDIDRIGKGDLMNAYKEMPDRVIEVLSDEKTVSTAVSSLYGTGMPLGSNFENLNDLTDQILDTFTELSSVTNEVNPFVAPLEDYEERIYHTGAKPQLFDDLNKISSFDDLQNYLSAHPSFNDAAAELQDLNPLQRSKRVKDNLAVLKDLPTSIEALRDEALFEQDESLITMNGLADQLGVKREVLDRAIGSVPANLLEGGPAVEEFIRNRAESLQYGWALQSVAEVLSSAPEEPAVEEGGAGPKVQKALNRLVPSSRQVRILSKSAPITQKVMELRQAGLPFSPVRKTK